MVGVNGLLPQFTIAVESKFVPLIVKVKSAPPGTAMDGERLLMAGGGRTVNAEPALGAPLTVTITTPTPVASDGTFATMEVSLQLEMEAGVVEPGKVTALAPCDAPKFVPVMVTEEPTAPEDMLS